MEIINRNQRIYNKKWDKEIYRPMLVLAIMIIHKHLTAMETYI